VVVDTQTCPLCGTDLPQGVSTSAPTMLLPDDTRESIRKPVRTISERAENLWRKSIRTDMEPGMSIRGARAPSLSNKDFVPRKHVLNSATYTSPNPPDYEIVRILGEGGMGKVYQTRQMSMNRLVAIKMLNSEVDDRSARQLFLDEAIITGYLDHPNIVPIYDVGRDEQGRLFYSMKQEEPAREPGGVGSRRRRRRLCPFPWRSASRPEAGEYSDRWVWRDSLAGLGDRGRVWARRPGGARG
jgi:hypothetical protein